ncbi:MAG: DUF4136 domain-containing protein [Sphingomicrobium sp.]
MRIRKFAAAAALSVAAISLTACASGLNTQVSRYQAAAIPAGQSFYVIPSQGAPTPQFYRYATMISQQLAAQGFHPAGAPQLADMLVRLDYGVDEGKTEYAGDPFYGGRGGRFGPRFGPYGWANRDPWYDPSYGIFYGRPYYSRWGGSPYYYGWDDPFWYGSSGYGYDRYGSFGNYPREYTVYKSYLDMDIVTRANNAPLFEGHAKARSQTDALDALVPNLIQAMFTGFPGRNGETVRITVPAAKRS